MGKRALISLPSSKYQKRSSTMIKILAARILIELHLHQCLFEMSQEKKESILKKIEEILKRGFRTQTLMQLVEQNEKQ